MTKFQQSPYGFTAEKLNSVPFVVEGFPIAQKTSRKKNKTKVNQRVAKLIVPSSLFLNQASNVTTNSKNPVSQKKKKMIKTHNKSDPMKKREDCARNKITKTVAELESTVESETKICPIDQSERVPNLLNITRRGKLPSISFRNGQILIE